ncbi:hypothetical protein FRC02_011425, partial [Tulasnella sp. 418]
ADIFDADPNSNYPPSEPDLSTSVIEELTSTPEDAAYYKEPAMHTHLFNIFRRQVLSRQTDVNAKMRSKGYKI